MRRTAAENELVDLNGRMVPRWYAEYVRAEVDRQIEKLRALRRPSSKRPRGK